MEGPVHPVSTYNLEHMLKYPLGIQTFEKIREDGLFYVDKTDLVYRLVKTGKVYSLSRPRRFDVISIKSL